MNQQAKSMKWQPFTEKAAAPVCGVVEPVVIGQTSLR